MKEKKGKVKVFNSIVYNIIQDNTYPYHEDFDMKEKIDRKKGTVPPGGEGGIETRWQIRPPLFSLVIMQASILLLVNTMDRISSVSKKRILTENRSLRLHSPFLSGYMYRSLHHPHLGGPETNEVYQRVTSGSTPILAACQSAAVHRTLSESTSAAFSSGPKRYATECHSSASCNLPTECIDSCAALHRPRVKKPRASPTMTTAQPLGGAMGMYLGLDLGISRSAGRQRESEGGGLKRITRVPGSVWVFTLPALPWDVGLHFARMRDEVLGWPSL